jgi:Na+/proline symporter
MWSMIGAGQPSAMVRLMSFKDSPSLRRALLLVCSYYFFIYILLVLIFVCARAIFPTEYLRELGTEGEPDSIMPAMIRRMTRDLPMGAVLAGFLLAAPYAAIMSTVAAFLLMISSSLVRDLYQRTLNPSASPAALRRASYGTTALVGLVVMLGAINPPGFLQYIIVFTASGQGCAFLVPVVLALYWPRTTRQGVMAGMLGGFLVVFGLYALGWTDSYLQDLFRRGTGESGGLAQAVHGGLKWVPSWGEKRPDAFAPLYPGGLDPLVWGLLASLLLTVGVSLRTRPDEERVRRYFPA